MDPIAHTLAGAALAETGLRRRSRYATATLVIGANLPDIDVIATFWGEDAMLYWRRGWSHGVLAMLVLPLLLTGAIWLWHRWRGHIKPEAVAWRPDMILLLSYLAVLSHPLLDWLNTYGVRLLMPFDGRWFYGDTLFIIDPWLWLLSGAAILWARRNSSPVKITGGALLLGCLVLLLAAEVVSPLVRAAWIAAAATLLLLIWRAPRSVAPEVFSGSCLALLAAYIGLTGMMARHAEQRAQTNQPGVLVAQSNPIPGTPFRHRLVMVLADQYLLVTPEGEQHSITRANPEDPVIRAAQVDPSVRGFVNWMRFPYYEVETGAAGWTVHIRDLRYQGPDEPAAGIGHAVVEVPYGAARH